MIAKSILLFIFGVSIGSFINVIRYRYKKVQSIIIPRSYCDNCKKKLNWYLNIPLISWILLKGKCKFCKFKIPYSYPLIETIVGFVFVLNIFSNKYFSENYQTLNLALICVFSFFLITISLLDIDHFIIPNNLNLNLAAIAIPVMIFLQLNENDNSNLFFLRIIYSIIIFLILESFSYFYNILFKKFPYGMGDSKLISAFILWLGIKGTLITIFLSIYLAGFFILFSKILQIKKYNSKIPFGPFLSLGAYLTILFGNEFWLKRLFFL